MELQMRLSSFTLPAAFLHVISRWVSIVSEGSNVTPRNLYWVVQLMEVSLTLMLSWFSLNLLSLFPVPKSIASVFAFSRFMISSFLQNQVARLLTSWFRWLSMIIISLFDVKITVSSAYVTIFVCISDLSASLKWIRNRGGPMMDPWGTPVYTEHELEKV